ncbi:MAG: FecR domain-containing protein [Cyclobacteriaceae bacterium]
MSDKRDENIGKRFNPMISSEERESLEQGAIEDFKAFESIWDNSSKFTPPTGKTADERWSKLEPALDEDPVVIPINRSGSFLKAAGFIAAAISLFALLYILKPSEVVFDQVIVAQMGERIEYVLPDRSIAVLNAGSEISYSSENWANERRVKMVGEVYFEVEKSSAPFIAKIGEASVEVLGTSFNVKSRNEQIEVACKTGKVAVKNEVGSVMLVKGFATNINSGSSPVEPFEVGIESIGGWASGQYQFTDTPLHHVFEELERQYQIEIQTQLDLTTKNFTGSVSLNNLKQSLTVITLSAGIQYEIQDKAVTLF